MPMTGIVNVPKSCTRQARNRPGLAGIVHCDECAHAPECERCEHCGVRLDEHRANQACCWGPGEGLRDRHVSKRDTRRKRAKWRNRPRGQIRGMWFDEAVKFKPRHWRCRLRFGAIADSAAHWCLENPISNPGER